MKLEFLKLSKTFLEEKVINNLSFKFEECKLYVICGESGCGKTTLLNLLSLIEAPDKKSEIFYDNQNVLKYSDEEKRSFRLKNIGYIFQSFNLFNDDTVFNNIALVIDSISNFSNSMRKRKIKETLKMVGLENLEKKFVRDLSGGEKQRVAIARALVNNPRIIFADEPTGSLDETNSNIVFDILRKISSNCTVICVTHDRNLAKNYADSLLILKDSKITETIITHEECKSKKNFLIIERKKKDKGTLSNSFILHHFYNTVKVKKFRFIISSVLLSISLFSIGLSVFFKDGISTSLKNSFSSILNGNSLVLKKKGNVNGILDYTSVYEDEVKSIFNDYKYYLDYYGTDYLVNFESFFKDLNTVYDVSKPIAYRIDCFNARSFNEFKYVKSCEKIQNIYPNNVDKIMDDEVIISLNYAQMKKECEHLQIARSFESLGEYAKTGNYLINLAVTNKDWNYNDNVSFRVRAVIIDQENNIYHTNNLFNEKLFEKRMMIPSSLNTKKIGKYPWIMKKVYYLKTKDFQSNFLNKISVDEEYKNYLFDSDSYNYSPKTCKFEEPCYSNKLFIYRILRDDIPLNLSNVIKKYDNDLSNFYYSTNSGYVNLGTTLFSGFARETYFSLDKTKIDNLINTASRLKNIEIGSIKLEENVLEGYAYNISENSVHLSSKYPLILEGRKAENPLEIVISSKMNEEFGGNALDKDLFVTTLSNKIEEEFITKNYFRVVKLYVVGIADSGKNTIYNDPNFSISLFRDLFQFSSFDIITNSIVFELDRKISNAQINSLNKTLEFYEFTDPLDDFENGINETLSFLEYALVALAIVTLFSSIVLIGIINYINIVEAKRDFSILFVLGFSFNEILKMQFIHSLLPNLLSFILASFSIILTSNIISELLTEKLGISTIFYVNFKPFLIMFLAIILVSLLSVIMSIAPIKKINITKELH